jgi:putative ABC transport system substrate-binding protein
VVTRHKLPTIYANRELADAGGLMAYGATDGFPSAYRQAGVYAGRILKGEKAGELPVAQPTKFTLIINLKAAKAIHLAIPESFLLRADEVIE